MATQTDKDWLLAQLSDGRWHSLNELLRASFDERGHGLTVHSRAADLRKDGHRIVCEHVPGAKRGNSYQYRLAPPLDNVVLPAGWTLTEIVPPFACAIDESAGLAEIPGQLTLERLKEETNENPNPTRPSQA